MRILPSVWLRDARLWLACRVGLFQRGLTSGWAAPLAVLALVALGTRVAELVQDRPQGTWFNWWTVLALYVLLTVMWWAVQARRRVIVEEFVTHAPKDDALVTGGLGALLIVEIARLRDLYQIVDEQRPTPTAVPVTAGIGRPVDATIKVEDVGEFLRNSVSAESELSLGPLKIPAGALMAVAGRIVRGPRVVGAIHRDGDLLTVTVQMLDRKRPLGWRVDRRIAGGGPGGAAAPVLDDVVRELAYRMFTDLELRSSVRWQATRAFAEGLRAYRECLRTPKDRMLILKQAETRFIESLAEDTTFDLAYYNLGVVYTEMKNPQAAEAAFTRALAENPQRWQAYYALALRQWEAGRDESVIQLCRRIVDMRTDHVSAAHALNLRGMAELRLGRHAAAARTLDAAVSRAWRARCAAERNAVARAARGEGALIGARAVARDCLWRLALAERCRAGGRRGLRRVYACRKAEELLHQALSVPPAGARLHHELGALYYARGRSDRAAHAFASAAQIDPTCPVYWAASAKACARLGDATAATYACRRALSSISEALDAAVPDIAEAYALLGMEAERQRVLGLGSFLSGIDAIARDGPVPAARLNELLMQYDHPGREWEYARVALALGERRLDAGEPAAAEVCFRNAIDRLAEHHQDEIRREGLRVLLARALADQEKYAEALKAAEDAVTDDPLSAYERAGLGAVYMALGEYERARAVYEVALLRKPDDVDTHQSLGACHWHLVRDQRDPGPKRAALGQSIKYYRQALELCTSAHAAEKAEIQYWLGRLYAMTGEYDRALGHLRAVRLDGPSRMLVALRLGEAFLRNAAYDASVDELLRAVRLGEAAIGSGAGENDVIGRDVGDGVRIGEALASANTLIAFSYAERDGDLSGLDRFLDRARAHIDRLKDSGAEKVLRAACTDVEGWLRFKQGDVDGAIATLTSAITLCADPEAYLHLARACLRRADTAADAAARRAALQDALRYNCHAADADPAGQLSPCVAELTRQIEDRWKTPVTP